MSFSRRAALISFAALGTTAALPRLVRAAQPLIPRGNVPRVVIVGGGWGGLAAARRLRELAPQIDVLLIERASEFRSLPLSNRWLIDQVDERLLRRDYGGTARSAGYQFLQADVTAVDREHRQVHTAAGVVDYDWLILAVGIRDDYRPWFGNEPTPAAEARRRFGSAWQAADIASLKARLAAFSGGDLLMTIPPLPYRCPPAPYERACMVATLIRRRQLKARVVLLDPNPMMQVFSRVFGNQYRDLITYVPQARIKAVDPFGRTVTTDFETLRFDDAILMPPQQAGDLAWQAGLVAAGTDWAAVDPASHRTLTDPRVFVIGDMIDRVSPLFGHYPKTGEMALRQGQIAAAHIAAEAAGREAPKLLPASTCFVLAGTEPMEMARIETAYRLRGDGLIQQAVKQHYDAQPRDEDVAWARGMFAELFGAA